MSIISIIFAVKKFISNKDSLFILSRRNTRWRSTWRYSIFRICRHSCLWSRLLYEVSRLEKLESKHRNCPTKNRSPTNWNTCMNHLTLRIADVWGKGFYRTTITLSNNKDICMVYMLLMISINQSRIKHYDYSLNFKAITFL